MDSNELYIQIDELYKKVDYINDNIHNLEKIGKILKYQMELPTLLKEIEEDLRELVKKQ